MSEKTKGPKRDYRTGRITIEKAKERFHEYYDQKAARGEYETPLGAFKAKLFDMMYTKKKKFLIKCNNTDTYDAKNDIKPHECEKGSVKYLLEAGPKTFDVQHVDAFKDDELFDLVDHTGKMRKFKAKGHTKRKPIVDDDEDEVYGPRSDGKLYSGLFRKQLAARSKEDMTSDGKKGLKALRTRDKPEGDGNNLVDGYWDKYYKQKETGVLKSNYERKNKKRIVAEEKPELLLDFTIGSEDYYSADEMQFLRKEQTTDKMYQLYRKNGELLIHNGEKLLGEEDDDIEYISQKYYLQKLGILSNKTPMTFNEDLDGVKLFNLKLKETRRSKVILLDINLNLFTGDISYDADTLSNKTFKTWYSEWEAEQGQKPKILDFWTRYSPSKKLESIKVAPIKELQLGGYIDPYAGREYSSSSDEYSIYSSDDE